MRKQEAGYVGHARGACHKVALLSKVFGDKGDNGDTPPGESDSVTHGAGSAAPSVTPGSDNYLAFFGDAIEKLITGQGGRIALVESLALRCG